MLLDFGRLLDDIYLFYDSYDMSQIQKTESPKVEYRSIIGDSRESSFSVCIPKGYTQDLDLHKGDYVRITREDSKLIIEKAK
jgi:hypothetical protein